MKTNIFDKQYKLRKPNKFLKENLMYPVRAVTRQSDGTLTGYPDHDRMTEQQKLSFWSFYHDVRPIFNLKGVQY